MNKTTKTMEDSLDHLQIIRPKKVCELAGISIPTLYRWEAEGRLPVKKIKIGPGSVGFRKVEVEKWLKEGVE